MPPPAQKLSRIARKLRDPVQQAASQARARPVARDVASNCLRSTETQMASASTAFFAMVNSLAASFSPRSWAGATPTGSAGSRCTRPRIVRHQRTSAPEPVRSPSARGQRPRPRRTRQRVPSGAGVPRKCPCRSMMLPKRSPAAWVGGEPACRPGSVHPRKRGPAAIHLGLPLPAASCGPPASFGRATLNRSRRPRAPEGARPL